MRLLITAGPTREPLDPVRYLSNRSSGAMGMALAAEAVKRGHIVRLVLGPVALEPPPGVSVTRVETALEMLEAVLELLPGADAILCAAAVADYRPASRSAEKLKRNAIERLELVENPDIAAAVGARRGNRPSFIFALETSRGLERARAKLEAKNADLCVLNSPAAIGAERACYTLVRRDGTTEELDGRSKSELAARLLSELTG